MSSVRTNLCANVHVVLVRTLYPLNVGYVSRVMANLGAGRLILINPQCELDLQARQGAAGAQSRLIQSTRYNNWTEFFASEPEGLRFAFSMIAKKATDSMPFAERMRWLASQPEYSVQPASSHAQPIYFIFGPEDYGLTNEDMDLTNFICRLPISGDYESMNLSHAVMLALYVLSAAGEANAGARGLTQTAASIPAISLPAQAPANNERGDKFLFPNEPLRAWLETLGLTIGDDRRTDAFKVIKRILLNNLASAKELRILEAVVNQTVRKLRGAPAGNEARAAKSESHATTALHSSESMERQ